eukprot:NODE_2521_length_1045_cov_475.622004_g2503_i0.p1 GENE.NODE_2521_length_1045_cov_475.622004_g2503_i0~~NODE_2521_length_1045_cov_475.622004_g2503_i0.p1  ORF type:complete len:312 (+),score=99.74 NODE_2521_length_1045_cov_475.622004_g2503_i0:119-937(+)
MAQPVVQAAAPQIAANIGKDGAIKLAQTPESTSQLQGPLAMIIHQNQHTVVFKYRYDHHKKSWFQSTTVVKIEPKAFSEGALRAAYKMLDLTKPTGQNEYVAKRAKQAGTPNQIYFADVEMQQLCRYMGDLFNMKGPPKKVHFVDAFLVESLDHATLWGVEPFLRGEFEKHNNNYGFTNDNDRNTPQAFSHFTYCGSQGQLIIVDIQGVGDHYTDPQIHTKDGKGFGAGNIGAKGFQKFFETHRCNSICVGLGIAKKEDQRDFVGTRMDGPA